MKIIVKCVKCGNKRVIQPYEIPQGKMPMCAVCGNVMLPESVKG